MTTTIALAGKGGVGKTTIAAMVVKYLAENKPGAILSACAKDSACSVSRNASPSRSDCGPKTK